jgi:hypothetical protein
MAPVSGLVRPLEPGAHTTALGTDGHTDALPPGLDSWISHPYTTGNGEGVR